MTAYLSTGEVAALAAALHATQTDKAGRPYVLHLAAVANGAGRSGFTIARQAGWLHDALEDVEYTRCTADQLLRAGVDPAVVRVVQVLTKRPGEPYLDAVARAAADPLARRVKLADNADNADPARLAALLPPDRERLTAKYAAAREVLEQAVRGVRP